MIRLPGIAAALIALCGVASPAAAEGWGFSVRVGDPIQGDWRGPPRRADGERTDILTRPLPEPPRRPNPPHHRPRPPIYFWPNAVIGERRTQPPEREVVVIERPQPAPEPPAEPPPPAPRIDACRTAAAPAEAGGGSGLVRFNAPLEAGCPRFARPPSSAAPEVAESAPAEPTQ
jgi:hypothetical protein